MILAATAPDVITFVVGAVMIIGGALGVVASRNPVRAALCLVATLFGVAILFVEQEAQFLAAVQVIVYAGAIVVLFLFVIMLLGVDRADKMSPNRIPTTGPIGAVAALVTFAMIGLLARWKFRATGGGAQDGSISGPGTNVGKLADSLFTQYVFAFEATALLLVIAVVGAVVLSRRPGDEVSDDQEALPAPDLNLDDEEQDIMEVSP